MTDAVFRPRARILSVLGDQLIRDEVVAILELVKNSYDADARHVTVEIEDVTQPLLNGHIAITDDGHGMEPDAVTSRWMELATAAKTPVETIDEATGRLQVKPRTSPGGRIQLGEKGVGRLAAMKLGKRITMITRAKGSDKETRLTWDADAIESAEYLDQFRIPVQLGAPSLFTDDAHGTCISVDRIRQPWSTDLLKRIEIALRRLASIEPTSFAIRLVSPESRIDAVLGPLEVGGGAPYMIEGDIDENGIFIGEWKVMNYLGARPVEVPRKVKEDLIQLWQQTKPRRGEERQPIEKPTCVGAFHFAMSAYDLDPAGLRQAGLTVSNRDQIKEASGLSIFRDGFRILPYGERHDDWLELNQRRVNNPTVRFSNNQVIGAVRITRAGNPELRDKTNREGLIENRAYLELRSLVLAILSILEIQRFKVRPRRKSQLTGDDVALAIDSAKKVAAGERRVLDAIEEVQTKFAAWNSLVTDRHDVLLQVAGIGMAAETITHELDRGVHLVERAVNSLIAHRRVGASPAEIDEIISNITQHLADLGEIVGILQPLQTAKRARIQQLSIEEIVGNVVRLFESDAEDRAIKMTVHKDADFTVEATRADLIQVFMNLVDNALFWLQTVNDRRLDIAILGSAMEVLVRDSGPGIKPEVIELIFEPFFTTKEEGRGLGLYIVQDILTRRGWSIDVVPPDADFPGAQFLLRFNEREPSEEVVDG